ncbi:hypothetical protein R1sor_000493 [Riccia sorocarpa]|uniref:Uncharacterized protein n=1 Tax=Riccia sorocarpa TaxID=122646 RepID=A0ABD3GV79_9MARC
MEVEQERGGSINHSAPIDWLAGEEAVGGGSGGGWGDDEDGENGGKRSELGSGRDGWQRDRDPEMSAKTGIDVGGGPIGSADIGETTDKFQAATLWGFEPGHLFRSLKGDVENPKNKVDGFTRVPSKSSSKTSGKSAKGGSPISSKPNRFAALGLLSEDNDAVSATGETGEDRLFTRSAVLASQTVAVGEWEKDVSTKDDGETPLVGRNLILDLEKAAAQLPAHNDVRIPFLDQVQECPAAKELECPPRLPVNKGKQIVGDDNSKEDSGSKMEIEVIGEEVGGSTRGSGEKESVKPARRVGTGWLERVENVEDLIGNFDLQDPSNSGFSFDSHESDIRIGDDSVTPLGEFPIRKRFGRAPKMKDKEGDRQSADPSVPLKVRHGFVEKRRPLGSLNANKERPADRDEDSMMELDESV